MINPIDRLFAVEWMREKVKEAHRKATEDAEVYLAEQTALGNRELFAPSFGEDAGVYHYGKTREKEVVEYNLADWQSFTEWLEENQKACVQYILAHAVDFGTWWFEGDGDFTGTGELPEGISRVQYVEPSHRTAAKIYRPNYDLMGEVFRGGYLNDTVQNMLGGADELPGD